MWSVILSVVCLTLIASLRNIAQGLAPGFRTYGGLQSEFPAGLNCQSSKYSTGYCSWLQDLWWPAGQEVSRLVFDSLESIAQGLEPGFRTYGGLRDK